MGPSEGRAGWAASRAAHTAESFNVQYLALAIAGAVLFGFELGT